MLLNVIVSRYAVAALASEFIRLLCVGPRDSSPRWAAVSQPVIPDILAQLRAGVKAQCTRLGWTREIDGNFISCNL